MWMFGVDENKTTTRCTQLRVPSGRFFYLLSRTKSVKILTAGFGF